MKGVYHTGAAIFHVLFNARDTLLAYCKRVCESGDAKNIFYAFIMVFGLIAVASQPLHADYLDTWNWRNPLPVGEYLNSVIHGNGTFVAVGDTGTILTSPSGGTWTIRSSGTTEHLHGVTYGNSTFVAVGEAGTILTSPDSETWTIRSSGTDVSLHGVTYGNSTFVAVGMSYNSSTYVYDYVILTSPDGVTWTTMASSGTNVSLYGVTYGNSTFVAVGGYGESEHGIIFTSPDGATWTERTAGTNAALIGITYGNSTFVVVTYEGRTS